MPQNTSLPIWRIEAGDLASNRRWLAQRVDAQANHDGEISVDEIEAEIHRQQALADKAAELRTLYPDADLWDDQNAWMANAILAGEKAPYVISDLEVIQQQVENPRPYWLDLLARELANAIWGLTPR